MRTFMKCTLLLALALPLAAQDKKDEKPAAPPADQKLTVTAILHRQFGSLEKQFVGVAEAMPADKFDFVPTQGEFKESRTFAQEVRHVATANFLFAAALTGEKSPYTTDDAFNGPASVKTREETLKFMKDSFAAVHKALDSINDSNVTEMVTGPFGGKMSRLALGNIVTWHSFDHYGQMVVYLRMNGIVPPASRQQ